MLKTINKNNSKMKKQIRYTGLIIGLSLFLFELILNFFPAIVAMVLKFLSGDIKKYTIDFISSIQGRMFTSSLIVLVCEILIIIIMGILLKINPKIYINKPNKNYLNLTLKFTIWMMTITIIVSFIVKMLEMLVESLSGFTTYSPDFSIPDTVNGAPINSVIAIYIIYFISNSILPPIFEELLFRGVILHSLRRYGDLFAIVTTSILFGLWHGNFMQTIPICTASFILSVVVIKTGSIIPSIIIHFINNGIWTLISILQNIYGEKFVVSIDNIIMPAIIIVGFVLFKYNKRDLIVRSNSIITLNTKTKITAFILNPGMIIFLGFIVFQFASSFIPVN